MKFIDMLYTYETKEKKIKNMMKKVQNRKVVPSLSLITMPVFGDGLLEIYDYNQLLQPFYKKYYDDIVVVGIAKDRGSAMNLVEEIMQDYCDSDYYDENFNLVNFLGV